MSSLITGASGFVANYLISYLESKKETVIKTSLEHEKKDDSYITLDIENFENCFNVIATKQPSVIYHLAGIAAPQVCEKNFPLALRVNVQGTYNILKACEESQKKVKVVIISSAECYGRSLKDGAFLSETSECKPTNNYGLSKLMAENVAQKFMNFSKNKDMQVVIARPFNHIGPMQREGFVVPDFATQLVKIKKGLQDKKLMVGDLSSTRDFSDVRDIVKGYYLLAQKGQGVYNLCSGNSYKISEVLENLIDISGIDVEVVKDESKFRAGGVTYFVGDNSKIKKDLGWMPEITFKQSLKDTYEYILNQNS